MKNKKIYYIFNGSMPSKKAYGIQMAKMCESLIEAGADLEVILPLSKTEKGDIGEYYNLRVHIPTKRLLAPDWRTRGRLGFFLGGIIFMLAYSIYLLKERLAGRKGVVYTLDMDSFSFVAIPLLGLPYFLETHGGKATSLRNRFFFKHINGVITINNIIKDQISEALGILPSKMIVEPNGIDRGVFIEKFRDL